MSVTESCIIVTAEGIVRCLYDETLDLSQLGQLAIARASHVEPDADGRWQVDLSPVGGPPNLGPFDHRSDALAAERQWVETHLHVIVRRR